MMAATEGNLVGDVLLSASFVSYAGAALGRSGRVGYRGVVVQSAQPAGHAAAHHPPISTSHLPRRLAHCLARSLAEPSTGAFNAELRHELVAVSRADRDGGASRPQQALQLCGQHNCTLSRPQAAGCCRKSGFLTSASAGFLPRPRLSHWLS